MSGFQILGGAGSGGSASGNQFTSFGEYSAVNYATGGLVIDLSATYASLNSLIAIPKTIGTLPASEYGIDLNQPSAGKATLKLLALTYDKVTAIGNVQNQPSGVTVQAASGVSGSNEYLTEVSDSFDRANSTTTLGSADTGQAWTAQAGTWGISSNQAYVATRSGAADFATVDALEHGIATVDIATTSTADATARGLCVRLIDTSNALEIIIIDVAGTDRVVRIRKRVAGVVTTLADSSTASWTPGNTVELRAEFVGNRLNAYLNGVAAAGYFMTAAEEAVFAGSIKVGLFVAAVASDDGNGRFNDFLIQTAHYHAIDHNHGSFASGNNTNSGAGVLDQLLGSSIGTHQHNLDIPNFTSDSSIAETAHTHVDNSIYAHTHTESRANTSMTRAEIANGTALNTTWLWAAAGS